jgi:plasmid stabilization system protein ParE
MAYPYRFNEYSYNEYIEAFEWYELKEQGLGIRFMNSVEQRLMQISLHPEYYGKRHSKFRKKVQDFPYMIVFEFLKNKKMLHIVAVYHSKRDSRHRWKGRNL